MHVRTGGRAGGALLTNDIHSVRARAAMSVAWIRCELLRWSHVAAAQAAPRRAKAQRGRGKGGRVLPTHPGSRASCKSHRRLVAQAEVCLVALELLHHCRGVDPLPSGAVDDDAAAAAPGGH